MFCFHTMSLRLLQETADVLINQGEDKMIINQPMSPLPRGPVVPFEQPKSHSFRMQASPTFTLKLIWCPIKRAFLAGVAEAIQPTLAIVAVSYILR